MAEDPAEAMKKFMEASPITDTGPVLCRLENGVMVVTFNQFFLRRGRRTTARRLRAAAFFSRADPERALSTFWRAYVSTPRWSAQALQQQRDEHPDPGRADAVRRVRAAQRREGPRDFRQGQRPVLVRGRAAGARNREPGTGNRASAEARGARRRRPEGLPGRAEDGEGRQERRQLEGRARLRGPPHRAEQLPRRASARGPPRRNAVGTARVGNAPRRSPSWRSSRAPSSAAAWASAAAATSSSPRSARSSNCPR